MKSFKTPAIILKRMDLGEADRLLTLFTYERGKVRAINKGARKPLSKLAGHLEPFCLTDCQLQEGKNLYTITSADLIGGYTGIRDQLDKTSVAYYLLEIVDTLTVDEEAQPQVFRLLAESLQLLDILEGSAQASLMRQAFTLKLLILLGYRPELDQCVHCHQRLEPEHNRFSVRLGGILGHECRDEDDVALPVGPTAIKAMRLVADHPIGIVTKLNGPASLEEELERVIESYLRFQTGREPYSSNFVREVGKA